MLLRDTGATSGESEKKKSKAKELSSEELKAQREARLQAQANNPHYLKLGGSSKVGSGLSDSLLCV